MEIYLIIGSISIFTGFMSGLLGIGGGIIMAPLLLYVPSLFGIELFSMRIVAGLTIVQGLCGCLSGGLTHRKFSFISGKLSAYMGVSIFIAALTGGAAARFVSNGNNPLKYNCFMPFLHIKMLILIYPI